MSRELDWGRLLPLGAMNCPDDKQALWWEVFGGMRIRRGPIYQARCPKCQRDYQVLTPKEQA